MDRLSEDKDGVVSFEYVLVAGCIVAAVATAFGTGASGPIESGLATAITNVLSWVTVAAS
jgi:hypothetical protein